MTFRSRTMHLLLACAAALAGVQFALAGSGGLDRYPFDDVDRLAPAADFAPWADMMRRSALEPFSLDACVHAPQVQEPPDACPPVLRGARTVVLRGRGLPERERLDLVNRFVDRRRYLDTANDSRWETLASFLRRGGDCEDFAVAKYFLLRAMGVPATELRVVVAHTSRNGTNHALLAVRTRDAGVLLLDTDDRVYAAERPGPYRFLYSVNEIALWDHAGRARTHAALAPSAAAATAGVNALLTASPDAHPIDPTRRGDPP